MKRLIDASLGRALLLWVSHRAPARRSRAKVIVKALQVQRRLKYIKCLVNHDIPACPDATPDSADGASVTAWRCTSADLDWAFAPTAPTGTLPAPRHLRLCRATARNRSDLLAHVSSAERPSCPNTSASCTLPRARIWPARLAHRRSARPRLHHAAPATRPDWRRRLPAGHRQGRLQVHSSARKSREVRADGGRRAVADATRLARPIKRGRSTQCGNRVPSRARPLLPHGNGNMQRRHTGRCIMNLGAIAGGRRDMDRARWRGIR